ncbi:hypothetical protein PLESTF_000336000 [Pleodorina starrii]|nr:hypothetical protein PLESTF_000336000 [Pleodorina starrii]
MAMKLIVGAAQDGSTLTVLGSCGPGACAAPPGRVLTTPWAVAAAGGQGHEAGKWSGAATKAQLPPAKKMATLSWKSGSPISLPYEWHQLLGQTRFAETLSLHAVLEPLLLGGRLVGALLVVTYGGRMPHSKATREALPCNGSGLAAAPFTSPVTWTGGTGAGAGGGGGERGAGEGPPVSALASVASSVLRRLKKRAGGGRSSPSSAPSPGLLRGLGAALSQAAFAPHLQAVVRLCSACQSLATATTLADLSSIISATVSEALAAELHVNLAVRVAVVPPLHGQHGYLLPLADPAGELTFACAGLEQLTAANGSNSRRPASAANVNVTMSGPAGLPSTSWSREGKAAPFPLPSSLLLQLLRPGGIHARGGGAASTASSVHAGTAHWISAAYAAAEEPTVRTVVTKAYDGTTIPQYSDAGAPADFIFSSGSNILPGAREFALPLPLQLSAASASGGAAAAARGGGGGAVGSVHGSVHGCCAYYGGGGFPARSGSSSFVSGMVVSNLAAWMQDVERPSSDVALLIMAARGRASAAAAASAAGLAGRPSQGGAGGGGAMGGGPACLVAVAGCAPQRAGGALVAAAAAAAAAAINGSAHGGGAGRTLSSKAGACRSAEWVQNLEASMRGGVAVDLSMRYGNGYGGGSVRYDSGVSCGPCVALYISAQERLPTSLLRAVKDRAAAQLEVLLPACLSSLSMGPVRADLESLASCAAAGGSAAAAAAAALAAGGSRSKRSLISAAGGLNSSPALSTGGGFAAAAAAAIAAANASCGGGGAATPPYPGSNLPSPYPSQRQLHSAVTDGGGGGLSPLGAIGGEDSLQPGSSRTQMKLMSGLASRLSSALDAAGVGSAAGGGGGGGGRQISAATDRTSGSTAEALSGEIHLLAQQRWPEAGAGGGGGGGGAAAAGLGTSPCCAPPAASSLVPTAPSSQSRTTRGSPGSCVFGVSGCGEDGALGLGTGTGLLASMDVTGAMDDMVTSMRHNLDVWVASFWEMLRDNTAHTKGGHTPGSYADDDLRFLRIYQQLGSGGAASVYAGVLLGMDVAVKVIEPPPEVDMEALAGSQAPPREAEEEGGPAGDAEEAEGEGERMASLAAAVRQAQMRELVRSARECAVLTTLSHPAIVQVYSFHNRVQVVPGEGPDRLPRLVPVPPGEGGEAQGPLHSVLIMERCDLGSLADALDNGMFKKAIIAAAQAAPAPASNSARPAAAGARPSNGQVSGGGGNGGFSFSSVGGVSGGGIGGGAAMRAIYLTLLEVALALRHLHSMNLVHCDVKVANVLLKSSASDPRGFTCKLSDFGLINLLRDHEGEEGEGEERKGQEGAEATDEAEAARESNPQAATTTSPSTDRKLWMRNADAAGTVTHLAPECFQPGSKLDQSVDIYAFGIVMWEIFTRKPPYAEFAPDFEDLPTRVVEGLRPRFPSHCPAPFRALAQACWCADPDQRPSAAAVVTCLQTLLEGWGGAGGGAGIGGGGITLAAIEAAAGRLPPPPRHAGAVGAATGHRILD